jgi:methionyl-tRNA formyltransferase
MKILFMGTPEFAVPCLQNLAHSSHHVVGVFTQPDRPVGRSQKPVAPPVKQLALNYHLPVHSPEKIKTDEVRGLISQMAPELIVVVAYGRILPAWMLDLPPQGAINVHASLLPKYRGAAPIQWSIAHGEIMTGITTMKMDAGMDTGDILLQREVPILPEDNALTMHDKLMVVGADLLLETIKQLEAGRLKPAKQDDSGATLAPLLKKEDGRLDWRWPAAKIHNYVRGLNPWPGTYTLFRGKRLRIWKTEVLESSPSLGETPLATPPGTIIPMSPAYLSVKAGDGKFLTIHEAQPEGHRHMTGTDLINGFRIKDGEILG